MTNMIEWVLDWWTFLMLMVFLLAVGARVVLAVQKYFGTGPQPRIVSSSEAEVALMKKTADDNERHKWNQVRHNERRHR